MFRGLKSIILLIILLISVTEISISQERPRPRIYRTNPNYKIDDWISYTMTRWMRSVTMGYEYLYIATTSGVARFNYFSKKWTFPLTMSNGLASNDIRIVAYEFDRSNLWCVTSVSVSCYFSTAQRWENYYFDEMDLSGNELITSLGFDQNNVWLESSRGELLKGYKEGGGGFYNENSMSESEKEKMTWYGARDKKRSGYPNFFMSDGYWFYSDGYITDINLNRYVVSSMTADKWNNYWVTTLGLGLGVADVQIQQLELLPGGLFINDVTGMAIDFENNIFWIGGMGDYEGESGITSWDVNNNSWNYYRAQYLTDIPSDQVSSIVVDYDGLVWIGTDEGVAQFNRNKDNWTFYDEFDGLTDDFVYDVACDEQNIWVATANGVTRIYLLNATEDSVVIDRIMPKALYDVEIYDVEVMDNLVWMGTEFGVYVYDMDKDEGGFQAEVSGPRNQPVYAVSVYGDEVWFGFEGGIEVYDVEQQKWLGGSFRRFNEPEVISYIVADEKAVWAGTEQNGVLKYDRDSERWIRFTVEDGLPDNAITVIVMDGDYVWFGGPQGITQFYWNAPYRVD